MWKVEVKLDEEKIRTKSEYNLDDMYAAIDKAFVNGAYMESPTVEADGTRIYIAPKLKNQDHFAMIGAKIIAFMDAEWFTANVRKFILGNNGSSSDPNNFSREDILKAWKVGVSCN
ncbi:MAG: hypothetical protein FWG90_09095 [Oscillospiraceae bacterium]|nr:hypothetical protein [Oscillospiraceae bacterium]